MSFTFSLCFFELPRNVFVFLSSPRDKRARERGTDWRKQGGSGSHLLSTCCTNLCPSLPKQKWTVTYHHRRSRLVIISFGAGNSYRTLHKTVSDEEVRSKQDPPIFFITLHKARFFRRYLSYETPTQHRSLPQLAVSLNPLFFLLGSSPGECETSTQRVLLLVVLHAVFLCTQRHYIQTAVCFASSDFHVFFRLFS